MLDPPHQAQVNVAMVYKYVPETLVDRRKMDWSVRRLSPFSFIGTFRQSRSLVALAAWNFVRHLPRYYNVVPVYQRSRFQGSWGPTQELCARQGQKWLFLVTPPFSWAGGVSACVWRGVRMGSRVARVGHVESVDEIHER